MMLKYFRRCDFRYHLRNARNSLFLCFDLSVTLSLFGICELVNMTAIPIHKVEYRSRYGNCEVLKFDQSAKTWMTEPILSNMYNSRVKYAYVYSGTFSMNDVGACD